MGKIQIKNTHTSFSGSVRNTVRKLCKYLIFSVYGGERGIKDLLFPYLIFR